MSLDKAFANVRAFVTNKALEPGWDDDEQIVASAPWGGVDCLITIGDLRELIEAHLRGRWNIDELDRTLLICRGLHDKADACEIERYVPEGTVQAAPSGDGLDLAEQSGFVWTEGGDYTASQPAVMKLIEAARATAAPERGSARKLGLTIGRLIKEGHEKGFKGVYALTLDEVEFDEGVKAGTWKIDLYPAESDVGGPVAYAEMRKQHWLDEAQRLAELVRTLGGDPERGRPQPAIQERAEICRALGCVDKPGVPLEFVKRQLENYAEVWARNTQLIRSWDPATPTERQELDRMRRGWGPSTPTERNRRHQDVLGCLSVLSGALADLAAPDEGEGEIPEAASEYIDAAYERLDKRHNEMLAICNSLDIEPMEWPDIMAAEERGAMAMRLILEHSVKGLRVMPEKLMADTHQNIGIAKALGAIERAPLPHYYDGSGLDDVAEILALREDNDESGARKARRERDAWKKHAAENAIAADRLARACFNAREALKPFAAIEPDTGAVLPREVYEAAVAAVKDPGLIEPVSQSRLLAALRIVERQDNGWDPKLVGADRLSKARPGDVTINVPTARCWLQFEPGSSTGTDELTRPGVGFTLVAYPDSSGEWPCGVIPRDEASKLHQMLQTFLEKHPVEAPR
jgi:hypothetical protein